MKTFETILEKISGLLGWICLGFLFALIVFAANIEIKDLDLWLHLAMGGYFWETFHIPSVDILSCTKAGVPWNNHEWLFQALVYMVYDLGGTQGLILMQVLVVVITFILLFILGYSRERQLGSIIFLLLILLVYQLRFTHRPEIFSLLFFALFIYKLALYLDHRLTKWILFFIQVIWTNMHGFFILGPAIIGIGLLAETSKRKVPLPFEWNTIGRLNDEDFRNLKHIFVFVCVACFINPQFIKGALYPLTIILSSAHDQKIFYKHISELAKPITWDTLFVFSNFLYYKILILASALTFWLNRRKIDLTALLLWVGFLLFSLVAVRNIVYFAFAAYFAIVSNLQFLKIQWSTKSRSHIAAICIKVIVMFWMLDYFDGMSLRGYYDFDRFERKSEYGGVAQRTLPHKAADFLARNNIKGNFFNNFNSGSYLIGRTFPNIRVFIDGRTEIYGAKFFEEYQKIWHGDMKLFEEKANAHNITGVFLNCLRVPVPKKTLEYFEKSPEWKLVYFDYDALIYLKDVPANQVWINQFEIDLSKYQPEPFDLVRLGVVKTKPYRQVNRAYSLYRLGYLNQAAQEAQEGLRVQADNFRLVTLMGKLALDAGDYMKAYEHLRFAKLLRPQDAETRFDLARSLVGLNAYPQAKKMLKKALALKPGHSRARELFNQIEGK